MILRSCRSVLPCLLVLSLAVGGEPPDSTRTAARIVGAALVEGDPYGTLAYLSDRIGARLSGSAQLEQAVEWTTGELKGYGLSKVWNESVMVPHWTRGSSAGAIVSPARHEMPVLALGGSVATPDGGITAEVIEVSSFDELELLGADDVRGKIVLYNKEILADSREHGYGSAVGMRHRGASAAARLGAVGMLIRSLGTVDYRLPHTGSMAYEDGVQQIPAAAIAAEDAELIHRLLASGQPVQVHYELGCRTLPDAESFNVIADLRGREKPEEIVLIGAHLDSWDVGTGAIDDGSGVAIVMETMRLLSALELQPRRTVRVVLFTNEENGLRGGRDYAERHLDELPRHVAAVEADAGAGSPRGYRVSAGEGGVEMVEQIAAHLTTIGANSVRSPGGGADISPMRPHGVPQIATWPETTHYFDYHHTMADTLDKVDEAELRRNVAAMALLAYMLAEQEETLPRLEPTE